MAFLAAEAFDFGYRQPLNAGFLQGLFDFIQLEWLDDRFDLFHPPLSPDAIPLRPVDHFQRAGTIAVVV
jgi:hypothetical protein